MARSFVVAPGPDKSVVVGPLRRMCGAAVITGVVWAEFEGVFDVDAAKQPGQLVLRDGQRRDFDAVTIIDGQVAVHAGEIDPAQLHGGRIELAVTV